jgi:hypothetical protein
MKTVFVVMKEYYGDVCIHEIFQNKYLAELYKGNMTKNCFDPLHTYYWVDEWEVK